VWWELLCTNRHHILSFGMVSFFLHLGNPFLFAVVEVSFE